MDQIGEGIRKLIMAGIGAVAMTKERSEDVLKELVRKGELTVEQGKVLNEELKHNVKEAVRNNVTVNVVKDDAPHADVMNSIDSMDDDELAALKQRIYEAEQARKAQAETSAEEAKTAEDEPEEAAPEVREEAVFAAPEKPRFFYCIPNFQNPTGKTMSLAKRRAVYALAVRYGVPVLEDDPYGELRIAGGPVPSIKSMDTEGAVIYAGSFSKILCPGMRLAYCVCDKKLMAAFVVAKQCSDVHTNVWAQRVCEAMLTRTDMDAHIREIRKIYAAKAALMMEQLDEKCPQVRYTRPEGGMFIWGTLPEGADMPAFVRECLARKLALVPGNAFMVDEEAPCGSFRMNFSTPTPENIVKGVSVMAGVLAAQGL